MIVANTHARLKYPVAARDTAQVASRAKGILIDERSTGPSENHKWRRVTLASQVIAENPICDHSRHKMLGTQVFFAVLRNDWRNGVPRVAVQAVGVVLGSSSYNRP